LGDAAPQNIIVLPVIFEGQVKGVLELASFERFNPTHQAFLDQLTERIGIVLNTIEANMRTEDLLKQSQSLAQELGSRQEELQQTNQELQEKARLLAHQNQEVERKNQEVEQARQALEEKAKQLALTSKYKSEFLANMSHELRTPLNSLLILSDQLSKNPDGNLSAKQTEFAKTIHSSGNDLLMLINDILDLSKIESGTVEVDIGELRLADLQSYVDRTFRHVAESKGVEFVIDINGIVPKAIYTDSKRLQQVIKNLLSNAFKFTQHGRVSLTVAMASYGWNPENEGLNRAGPVLAISVADTGIGIPSDKQQIIFEAFQQADGSTSRKYGGTGLGLAISREISRLLGGEIRLVSSPGKGSTFTLYLPHSYTPQKTSRRAAIVTENGASHSAPAPPAPPVIVETPKLVNEVGDDRESIQPGDPVLLIVENDLGFAKLLLEAARDKGFRGLVTSLGAAALAMAREYKPDAITLDVIVDSSPPDMSIVDLIEQVGAARNGSAPPVILYSNEPPSDRDGHGLLRSLQAISFRQVCSLERLLDQTAFFLHTPITKLAEAKRRTVEQLYQDDEVLTGKKVLIVDDDIRNIFSLTSILEWRNMVVVSSETGRDAIRILQADPDIDIVLMDIMMPEMDGLDTMRVIRKLPQFNSLPIIAVTAKAMKGDREKCIEAGAWDYLSKPVDTEQLLGVLRVWLHRLENHPVVCEPVRDSGSSVTSLLCPAGDPTWRLKKSTSWS